MKNPYDILGVPPNATEEEIKEAYRQLSLNYDMSDTENPEVLEINTAYDELIRRLRGQASYAESDRKEEDFTYQSAAPSSEFHDIRSYIQNGRLADAEELLGGIPERSRSAEWYFLKGTICYNKGYLDSSFDYFETATRLDPDNAEYAAAFRTVQRESEGVMEGSPYQSGYLGAGTCDCYTSLLCLNCCCSCLRGGCFGV